MKRLTVIVLIMLFSSFLTGCGARKAPTAGQASLSTPVKVMKIARTDMKMNYTTSGQIEASTETTIAPKVAGRVTQVNIKLGDRVKKGQVLFSIDAKDAHNQVTQAEASLEITKTSYATAAQALQDAQTNYDRYCTLYQSGAASKYEFEQANTKLVNAQLALQQAQQQINQAGITLSTAQQNLADYTVSAPANGVISALSIENGEMVSSQTNAATLVNIDAVKVKVSIPESVVNSLQLGSQVAVTIDSLNKSMQGTLTTISPAADTTTMGYLAEITLANPSGIIKPGMSTKIDLNTGSLHNVIAVPIDAVIELDGQHNVYVVENNKAKEVSVEIGLTNDSQIEITKGLKEGQSIIIEGNKLLSDGQKVRVVNGQAGGSK